MVEQINFSTIFSQSQMNSSIGELADAMAGLEKKPTSLRQISDLVGKLKKETKIQFEVADIGRNNGYRVSPSWLYVEAGLNLRNVNIEHAEVFKQMWMRGDRIPPFLVKVVIFEGYPA